MLNIPLTATFAAKYQEQKEVRNYVWYIFVFLPTSVLLSLCVDLQQPVVYT